MENQILKGLKPYLNCIDLHTINVLIGEVILEHSNDDINEHIVSMLLKTRGNIH